MSSNDKIRGTHIVDSCLLRILSQLLNYFSLNVAKRHCVKESLKKFTYKIS